QGFADQLSVLNDGWDEPRKVESRELGSQRRARCNKNRNTCQAVLQFLDRETQRSGFHWIVDEGFPVFNAREHGKAAGAEGHNARQRGIAARKTARVQLASFTS